MPYYLGIDIGGTKIAMGVLNQTGQVQTRLKLPTPQTGAADVLNAIITEMQPLLRKFRVEACGVGTAGQIDPFSGRVIHANPNITGWTGTRIADVFSQALACPITVDNDVNAMAYGESLVGQGEGYHHLVYITVGTGIGGAIVLDGKLWHGTYFSAGEVGYLYAGPGITVEEMASGPAIAAAYNTATGGNLTTEQIAQLAQAGDNYAKALIEERASLLGEVLSPFLHAIDPQVLIVGGGVPKIGPLWWNSFVNSLRTPPHRPTPQLEILPATLEQDAVIVGAAMMAKQRTEQIT